MQKKCNEKSHKRKNEKKVSERTTKEANEKKNERKKNNVTIEKIYIHCGKWTATAMNTV